MPGFNVQGSDKYQPSSTIESNRAHRWRIVSLCTGNDGKSIISDDLIVYAKSLTLPSFSIDEESVMGGSIKYKFASAVNWEDVKVTFYDVYGLLDQINTAANSVWDPEFGLKYANDYKGDSFFCLTNGNGATTRVFTLKNSYIKNVSHSDLSYATSDIKEVTLTISYDWAENSSPDNVGESDFAIDHPNKPRDGDLTKSDLTQPNLPFDKNAKLTIRNPIINAFARRA